MRLRRRCTSTCGPGEGCLHLGITIVINRDHFMCLTRAVILMPLLIALLIHNGSARAPKHAEVSRLPAG